MFYKYRLFQILTAQRIRLNGPCTVYINWVLNHCTGGAPLHPPAQPLGYNHFICMIRHSTCVLWLSALYNCYLSENKVCNVWDLEACYSVQTTLRENPQL